MSAYLFITRILLFFHFSSQNSVWMFIRKRSLNLSKEITRKRVKWLNFVRRHFEFFRRLEIGPQGLLLVDTEFIYGPANDPGPQMIPARKWSPYRKWSPNCTVVKMKSIHLGMLSCLQIWGYSEHPVLSYISGPDPIKSFREGSSFIIWLCPTRTANYRIHEFDWLESILTAV